MEVRMATTERTKSWFVLLKEAEDFEEFSSIIRKTLEEGVINHETVKITVEMLPRGLSDRMAENWRKTS
jgi:hypothetical protein